MALYRKDWVIIIVAPTSVRFGYIRKNTLARTGNATRSCGVISIAWESFTRSRVCPCFSRSCSTEDRVRSAASS